MKITYYRVAVSEDEEQDFLKAVGKIKRNDKMYEYTYLVDRTINHAQDLLIYAVEHGYDGDYKKIQSDILHAMFAIELIKDALRSADVIEEIDEEQKQKAFIQWSPNRVL